MRRQAPPTAPRRPSSVAGIQGTLALDLMTGQPGLPDTPELDVSRRTRVPHVADQEVRRLYLGESFAL